MEETLSVMSVISPLFQALEGMCICFMLFPFFPLYTFHLGGGGFCCCCFWMVKFFCFFFLMFFFIYFIYLFIFFLEIHILID